MNGVYEVLSEVAQNGTNLMTWKFAFDVRGGSAVTLFVKAFQSVSTDSDNFVFAYSTDDQTYTDVLTVSKTADDGSYQSQSLPASLQGRIYIRVSDTKRVASTGSLDKISIDHLFVRSEW